MRVVLSNSSQSPLYQQIKEQIGAAILSGELADGDALPSVRALARDLRISVITTTRAYAELAAEGFITTVPGKGAFVQPLDSEASCGNSACARSRRASRPPWTRPGWPAWAATKLVQLLDTLIQAELHEPI